MNNVFFSLKRFNYFFKNRLVRMKTIKAKMINLIKRKHYLSQIALNVSAPLPKAISQTFFNRNPTA